MEYLKMLRVWEWIKFFAPIPLIGAILAPATPFVLISVGVIFFCAIAFGFVVNNYFDVEIDIRNTKKVRRGNNPLSSGGVTKRGTFALMCVLLAIAITLACFLSPGISGDLNLNTHILLIAALFMIISCESLLTHQINDYPLRF